MSNEFRGTGNIAVAPTLKTVSVAGEGRKVAELRVFFDDYKATATGGIEQSGGFWLDVSVWGDTLAESVSQHLKKGARIRLNGLGILVVRKRATGRDIGKAFVIIWPFGRAGWLH